MNIGLPARATNRLLFAFDAGSPKIVKNICESACAFVSGMLLFSHWGRFVGGELGS
jgi:hypothetical protein